MTKAHSLISRDAPSPYLIYMGSEADQEATITIYYNERFYNAFSKEEKAVLEAYAEAEGNSKYFNNAYQIAFVIGVALITLSDSAAGRLTPAEFLSNCGYIAAAVAALAVSFECFIKETNPEYKALVAAADNGLSKNDAKAVVKEIVHEKRKYSHAAMITMDKIAERMPEFSSNVRQV